MSTRPHPDGVLSSAVTAITSAFGDPTRREIYLFAHERSDEDAGGVTAAEVAEQFDLHPNVARHHLDKLAGGGYVEVATGRTGVGRRSAVEALPGHLPGDDASSSRSATTTCSSRCSARRCRACPPPRPRPWPRRSASSTARRWPPRWAVRPATRSPPAAGRPALVPHRAARGRRRPHRPRVRRPRRAARRRAAHRVGALPLRRRRHRAPGDLRRRPRPGARHARRPLRRDRRGHLVEPAHGRRPLRHLRSPR